MKTKKIKIWLMPVCLLTVVLLCFLFMFFDLDTLMFKYREFIHYSKTHVGAVVYNETDQAVRVADYKIIHKLPRGESSRDIGIFDADGLVIDQPMYFENTVYFNGVLKFCDYARLKLVKEDGVVEIKAENVWICKLLNDFDFYKSVEEAFK